MGAGCIVAAAFDDFPTAEEASNGRIRGMVLTAANATQEEEEAFSDAQ